MAGDYWSREQRLERLEAALEELAIASNEDRIPILVEGDKDEIALRNLGIDGPILKINAGMPLFAFIEDYGRQHREAILLVDWDAKGGQLAQLLRDACQANVVALDETHRKALAFAVGTHVKTVESLDTHLRTLREG